MGILHQQGGAFPSLQIKDSNCSLKRLLNSAILIEHDLLERESEKRGERLMLICEKKNERSMGVHKEKNLLKMQKEDRYYSNTFRLFIDTFTPTHCGTVVL
tara:strand:+ start:645 stop:947 length:303 start_codon:yes stop_codon:yes gene_type:complete